MSTSKSEAERNRKILGIVARGRRKNTAHEPIANKIILNTNVMSIPLHSVLQDNSVDFWFSFKVAMTAGKKPVMRKLLI